MINNKLQNGDQYGDRNIMGEDIHAVNKIDNTASTFQRWKIDRNRDVNGQDGLIANGIRLI